MGAIASVVLLVVLGLLLVSAGIEDARKREIANWKNAAIALLAVPWWIANALAFWPDSLSRCHADECLKAASTKRQQP